MLTRILTAAVKTAAILTATSTTAVMAAGVYETGSAWAPINAISHIVDGDDVTPSSEFRPRESSIGLAVNTAAMAGWAGAYETALVLTKQRSTPLTAVVAAAAAYIIDYKFAPPRFSPGIEKRLSGPAIFLAYATIAVTLALSPIWNDYDDTRSTEPPIAR